MTSQILRDARAYEKTKEQEIGKEARPAFHLCARVGWMNDPNGFSFYQGKYHLFYQYYPYDCQWGPMHWGHAVSSDLLHWQYLPASLAPDMPYDNGGCFSGSAIQLDDGRQLLLYTGVRKEPQPDGGEREIQTQCIAVGDGMDYEKYEGNPVLTEKDLPEGGSRFDFRDPKIWRDEQGRFHCVVGNCSPEKDGRIVVFDSADGFHWSFEKILAVNDDRFGRMWECPDFFELDGRQVLLTSPQEMLPQGFEYGNGNGTLCLTGHEEPEQGRWVEETDQAIDYGIDFYAPQTVLAPDGRRIMIGWMQNWDTSKLYRTNPLWFGQMSIPRELSVKNGRLYQLPVRELENVRGEKTEYRQVQVAGSMNLEGIRGRVLDLELTIRPEQEKELYRSFTVQVAKNDRYHTAVTFCPDQSLLKIDRRFSGFRNATIHECCCQVNSRKGELKLRLLLDRFSVEVFANDGEHAMTATIYTEQEADGICFLADGDAVMDVAAYELEI